MKKLLLALLLMSASLPSSISAGGERIHYRSKKSKEAALLKALYGGYIAHQNFNRLWEIFSSLLNNNRGGHTFYIKDTLLPMIFFITSYSMTQQALNDLEEIAQYE